MDEISIGLYLLAGLLVLPVVFYFLKGIKWLLGWSIGLTNSIRQHVVYSMEQESVDGEDWAMLPVPGSDKHKL